MEADCHKLVALEREKTAFYNIDQTFVILYGTFITMVATLSFSACSERAGWVEFSSGFLDSPSPA